MWLHNRAFQGTSCLFHNHCLANVHCSQSLCQRLPWRHNWEESALGSLGSISFVTTNGIVPFQWLWQWRTFMVRHRDSVLPSDSHKNHFNSYGKGIKPWRNSWQAGNISFEAPVAIYSRSSPTQAVVQESNSHARHLHQICYDLVRSCRLVQTPASY